jgi:hypothetical protein
MSTLQKEGTFQVYLTVYDKLAKSMIKDGLVTVPVQLSGDYHLRINGVSLAGSVVYEGEITNFIPEPLFIQSAEFSSSLSNVRGICILPRVIPLAHALPDIAITARLQQYQMTRYDFTARLTGSLSFFLSVNSPTAFTRDFYPETKVFNEATALWKYNPVIVLDISYKRTDTGFFDA